MSRFARHITKFFKSRDGLLLLFTMQIFLIKAHRSKTVFIGAATVLVVGYVASIHLGMCPVKHIFLYLCKG